MKTLIKILCLSVLWFSCESSTEPQNVHGCLDSQACNYNSNANIDNNSCIYEIDCNDECGGDALLDNCDVCDNDTSNDCEQDECGIWGGDGVDADSDGICDDVDDCVGEYDCDGICNGNNFEEDCGGDCNQHIEIAGECFNFLDTEVFLVNQSLTEFPQEVFLLVNLEYLDLRYNSITGEIPSEIGQLTNLNFLLLDNNQFSGPIPNEIGNLVNLTSLTLFDNNLTGIVPESLCNQGDNTPYVSNNQLCPPYPDCISQEDIDSQDTSNCP